MNPGVQTCALPISFYCNNGKGDFLFHKRSKNCRDEQGRWDPGSGELEHGVTLEENVLREVMEEYGAVGEIQERLPAHDIFREFDNKKTHWLAVPFFVHVRPEDVRLNEPDKMDEFGWFRLGNLPSPLHSGFQYSYSRFQEYFKKYQ